MNRNDEPVLNENVQADTAPYELPVMPPDAPIPLPREINLYPAAAPKRKYFSNTFFFLFGILLPCISLGVELTTHMCAEEFFDPMPTVWHVFLVAFVPVSNAFLLYARGKDLVEYRSLLGITNGVTIGIATFYTLVYLPLLPIGIIGIIFVGLGFLPLTPVLALIASLVGRKHLHQLGAPVLETKLRLWTGFVLGMLAVVVTEIPATVTRIGMQMASSPVSETNNRGVKMLRSFGTKNLMLRSCYQQQNAMSDLVSTVVAMGDPVSTGEAKTIYYRVTGTPFNAEKPPTNIKYQRWDNELEFDRNMGGEIVAGQVKGLSLLSSRQDQSIDANAAVSYTEWTLVFKNISDRQREARAQIALPPGAVVSRLTLWINGEEREAAFGGRSQVREAYQQVAVQQRRDPVLVTTTGMDRVLLQCFPIQPNGGEMKVRLGITAPLQIETQTEATLQLPFIIERNFGVDEKAQHYVWVESKQQLSATNFASLKPEQTEAGKFALRGNIADAKLADGFIRATRTTNTNKAWTLDQHSKNPAVITQEIEEQKIAAPPRVIFVVDGSRQMNDLRQRIADSLAKLPDGIEAELLLASDGWIDLSHGVKTLSLQTRQEFAKLLKDIDFIGGHDNAPALLQAWNVAAEKPDSAIIWMHGAQPIEMRMLDELQQRYERRPNGPRIYDLQLVTGPNRLAENLGKIKTIATIPNRMHGLENLFAQWSGTASHPVITREKIKRGNSSGNDAIETSDHLARLWANGEVLRLAAAHDENKNAEAVKLAVNYQLVTPVSGAVVLETKEQYERNNLEAVNPNSVPTIPEPEEWLLIAVVGAVMLWLTGKKYVRKNAAHST